MHCYYSKCGKTLNMRYITELNYSIFNLLKNKNKMLKNSNNHKMSSPVGLSTILYNIYRIYHG